MKPTHYNKKTGVRHCKVRIAFTINKDLIIAALCDASQYQRNAITSRKKAEAQVRKALYRGGMHLIEWSWDASDEVAEDAETLAKKWFPEFFELHKV